MYPEYTLEGMVARGGIEPLTRGFSVIEINSLPRL